MTTNLTTSQPTNLKNIQSLAQESRHQLKALEREVGEIKVLIKQTSSEIERLGSRVADSARRVRELDANMDNFSRQEIRDVLASTQESEMHHFVMKGQLEMLEHKQTSLERLRRLLQTIVDLEANMPAGERIGEVSAPILDKAPVEPTASRHEPTVTQIIQAQEDERHRIARQLHDGPAQALTNLILRAEICQRMLDLSLDDARLELSSLKRMIVNTLQETRGFIFDLRPMILDDLGLMPTLRRHVEMFTSRTRIPIRLNIAGAERRLPPHVEVVVFRVVQEALDNAARHGKATEIQITGEIGTDGITVAVADNGIGFDVEEAMTPPKPSKAVRFRGIQEQAGAAGGQVSFESSEGKGSKVTVTIPL